MHGQEEPRNENPNNDMIILKSLFRADCFTMVMLIISFGPIAFHHLQSTDLLFPLLTSIATCAVVTFLWQWFIFFNPSKAIGIAFSWRKILTLVVWVFQGIFEPGVLANNIVPPITPGQIRYAKRILTASMANPNLIPISNINSILIPSMVLGLLSSILFVSINILLIDADRFSTFVRVNLLFANLLHVFLIMQVISNIIVVTITRIKYMNHTRRREAMDPLPQLRNTLRNFRGNIFFGSAAVPVLELIHLFGRTLSLLTRVIDFGFERAPEYINRFEGLAREMTMEWNYWGFVHVGAYNMEIGRATAGTMEMFSQTFGLARLIGSDLTGCFCFVCGVGGGAICSLVGFAIMESYPMQLLLHNFFIGYLMSRIAMAWPHACVIAYYVAYAENPENFENDTTIPDRIEELRRLVDD
ncbi:hypothetical protein FEM48_Zijuj12G0169000 [Ziziphus jujuba var. spinosa]|uniref:Uncharacterized protein n=1 Tax=Ziziphus jujuba var. spinosa TaxID=714518 RepID=A0A978UEI6_ZIZJJ|nr:uncharacterized protein LOC125419653 [Ziziphus jujuba var. spinosa]KAH7513179.1 hypothetical protein FEM48_Zijuj12G0169000 [Ziziphus jujuba var. spinosa]